jgi:hypothetical protein
MNGGNSLLSGGRLPPNVHRVHVESRHSLSDRARGTLTLTLGLEQYVAASWDPTGEGSVCEGRGSRVRGRAKITAVALSVACVVLSVVLAPVFAIAGGPVAWPQWGQNPQHTGRAVAAGQSADRIIQEIVYDPFVPQEQALNGGDLLAHYQAPLIDGNDVYMMFETGTFTASWNTRIWNERKFSRSNSQLTQAWSFQSDWKPSPQDVADWEPVFHAVLSGSYVYVPGGAGTIYKLRQSDGTVQAHIIPFPDLDQNVFTASPLTADAAGNIYYNAIRFHPTKPADKDVQGSWLVRVAPDDSIRVADYATLTPGAPAGTDQCTWRFSVSQLPWPPSPDAVAPTKICGSQRPGINVAPAIAPDGTIYTATTAHFDSYYSFLVAVNPDLTSKWAVSLRDKLNDGCNDGTNGSSSVLPPNGSPGGCKIGAHPGVDPRTNQKPAGRVIDEGSSSPTVMPDGSVLFGAYTRYNYARGHLMKFSSGGQFLGAYDFGWDTTAAITAGGAIVLKDNHYDVGSFCNNPVFCPVAPAGPYYITELNGTTLAANWKFQNTNTKSCSRNADGTLSCVSDHPGGFEWCINAPAIDSLGKVYANSEDGGLYVLNPDGTLNKTIFLNLAIGAAYTPLAIGADGLIYTENDGRLFVVGK